MLVETGALEFRSGRRLGFSGLTPKTARSSPFGEEGPTGRTYNLVEGGPGQTYHAYVFLL